MSCVINVSVGEHENLAKAAIPAYSAVSKSTDFTRVDVGGAEPSLDAGPVNETDRTTTLARRQ